MKIDLDVLAIILQKGWASLSGLITIFFVIRYFNLDEQGFFYLLLALVSALMFFDFGINISTTQIIARMNAEIDLKSVLIKHISAYYHKTKKRLSLYSYIYISLICLYFFLYHKNLDITLIQSFFIIIIYSIISIITLQTNLRAAIMDGLGEVKTVAFYRTISLVTSSFILWIGMANNFGFWAFLASQILNTFQFSFLIRNFKISKLDSNRDDFTTKYISLGTQQLQIALTGLGAYAVLAMPVFVLAGYNELELSGKFGMSLQLVGAITGVALTFLSAKAYVYSGLYAKRNMVELKNFHSQRVLYSWIFLIIAILILYVLIINNNEFSLKLQQKLVDTNFWPMIVITIFGIHYYNTQSPLMQAMGGDSLFIIALIRTFLIFASFFILHYHHHITFSLTWGYILGMTISTFMVFFHVKNKFQIR